MPRPARSATRALCTALLLLTSACVSRSIALETRLPERPPAPLYTLSDVPAFVIETDLSIVQKVEETGLIPLGLAYRWRFALGPEVTNGLEQSLGLVFAEVGVRDAPPSVTQRPALYLEPQIEAFDIAPLSLRTTLVLRYRLLDNRGQLLRHASIQGRSGFGIRQLAALFTGFLFPDAALSDSVERALQDVYTQLLADLDQREAAGRLDPRG